MLIDVVAYPPRCAIVSTSMPETVVEACGTHCTVVVHSPQGHCNCCAGPTLSSSLRVYIEIH
jgi:hypothetical protein